MRLRRRRAWLTMLLTTVAVLAVAWTALHVRARQQIAKSLEDAINTLDDYPQSARRHLHTVYEVNPALLLQNARRQALQRFIKAVHSNTDNNLVTRTPSMPSIRRTEEYLELLEYLEDHTGRSFDEDQLNILNKAHNSLPRLREQGSMVAWEAMLDLFDESLDAKLVSHHDSQRIRIWLDEMANVPLEEQSLNSTMNNTERLLLTAYLRLTANRSEQQETTDWLIPVPSATDPDRVMEAHSILEEARISIRQYSFNLDLASDDHFVFLRAWLLYSISSLQLGHVIGNEETMRLRASDYIAKVSMRHFEPIIPPADELFEYYLSTIEELLNFTREQLDQLPPTPHQQLLDFLTDRNMAIISNLMSTRESMPWPDLPTPESEEAAELLERARPIIAQYESRPLLLMKLINWKSEYKIPTLGREGDRERDRGPRRWAERRP